MACGIGTGTASEIALALKANRNVILLNSSESAKNFFKSLSSSKIWIADTPEQAMMHIKSLILSAT